MTDRPRTLGDLFHEILHSWSVFARFVLMAALFAIVLVLGLWAGARVLSWGLDLKPRELELSSNPRIILEQRTADGREYLLVVHPQGWNDTQIRISRGDEVELTSHGRVNISLYSLMETVRARRLLEERLVRGYADANDGRVPDSTWVPERHFPDSALAAMRLERRWIGPDGYPGADGLRDHRYPLRTRRKILPEQPFGMLVGAIDSREPMRADGFGTAFPVGTSETIEWDGAPGELWLIVNDVWDDEDLAFPEKFYIDNIGYFVVKVRVRTR